MQESERIRKLLGVSRAEFSRRYNIPIRTLEDWDAGRNKPAVYIIELLERAVREDIRNEKQREADISSIINNAIEQKDRELENLNQAWEEILKN